MQFDRFYQHGEHWSTNLKCSICLCSWCLTVQIQMFKKMQTPQQTMMAMNNIFSWSLCLIILIQIPRTIQTPQQTMMNNIFTCSLCLIIPIQMSMTIQTPQQTMMVINNIYLLHMLDNPNTNVQDNTNTTTHNDGDLQSIDLLLMLDYPNTNAQDNTNTTTHNDVMINIFTCSPWLTIPIQIPRTIQTPQHT